MPITKLIQKNPIKKLGYDEDDIIPVGGFGVILAPAGVGKTAFLVQMAFNSMFRDERVLHLSQNPLKKVCLWYDEMFHELVSRYRIKDHTEIWESLLPKRYIHSVDSHIFELADFAEKLDNQVVQSFKPELVVVDGFSIDSRDSSRKKLEDLKNLARARSMRVWFAVRTQKDEKLAFGHLPPQLDSLDDLFEVAIKLESQGQEIRFCPLKGVKYPSENKDLLLDPVTMLIDE